MQRALDPAAGPREGDVLAGKYCVEKVLGVGGMGVVVAALHIDLETRVAIKFLLPEMLQSPEAVSRFAREARAAVKITSEHVARVFDVGVLENGAPFMVMELLEGGDLSEWLTQRGPLSVEQAVDFLLQACVAVAEAHGLGIVHRDLKPANLFCVRRSDGQLVIKVLDFGISKLTRLSTGGPVSVTQTTSMMGSPLYMSPEQLRAARNADAQSDIWSLGVILFELLTGRTPFDGDTLSLVSIVIATEPAPLLRSLRSEAPLGLEQVISRCLEKDPKQRYRDVAELAAALQPFAPARSQALVERVSGIVNSTRPPPGSVSVPSLPAPPPVVLSRAMPSKTTDPVGSTVAAFPTKRRAALYVSLVGVALVSGVGAAILWRDATHRVEPPAIVAVNPSAKAASQPPASSEPAAEPVAREHANEPAAQPPATATAAPPAEPPSASAVVVAPPPPPAAPPPPPRAPSRRTNRTKPPPPPVASAAPAATPPPPPPATPAPECNPPYYYDPNGTRVFKKECF